MTAKPLAEAYEKLKELRRQADSGGDTMSFRIRLKAALDEVALSPDIEVVASSAQMPEEQTRKIRIIATKALADRVFGDSARAEAWLTRPNAGLSGQRPADLLRDELGTDVVREMLERIDHGIFA